MGTTRCSTICVSKRCKARKKCACRCGEKVGPYSLALEESCIKACNNKSSLDVDAFLCNNREAVFNASGTRVCDYQLEDSVQHQVQQGVAVQRQAEDEQSQSLLKMAIPILGLAILGIVLVIAYKRAG